MSVVFRDNVRYASIGLSCFGYHWGRIAACRHPARVAHIASCSLFKLSIAPADALTLHDIRLARVKEPDAGKKEETVQDCAQKSKQAFLTTIKVWFRSHRILYCSTGGLISAAFGSTLMQRVWLHPGALRGCAQLMQRTQSLRHAVVLTL